MNKDASKFTKDIIIMAFVSLLASISAGLRGGCFMTVIQKLNIRVRNALFKSITNQDIGFFDDMKTGSVMCFLNYRRSANSFSTLFCFVKVTKAAFQGVLCCFFILSSVNKFH